MRTALVILFLGVVVGAYLFYVRGMGVQPATSAPQTIERQGVARTYAWTRKAEMPTPGNILYVIGGGKRPGLSVSGANEALEVR